MYIVLVLAIICSAILVSIIFCKKVCNLLLLMKKGAIYFVVYSRGLLLNKKTKNLALYYSFVICFVSRLREAQTGVKMINHTAKENFLTQQPILSVYINHLSRTVYT